MILILKPVCPIEFGRGHKIVAVDRRKISKSCDRLLADSELLIQVKINFLPTY